MNQSLVHQHQREDRWEEIASMITEAAVCLQNSKAAAIIFCANTPHKVYEIVQSRIDIPVLHIADATANAVKACGVSKVGLVGTRFSMEQDFLVDRFAHNGVEVLVPQKIEQIVELHRIVQEELTFGEIKMRSKRYVTEVVQSMAERGAKGVVLGCTEFPLMFQPKDLDLSTFNTTLLHSKAAVEFILS